MENVVATASTSIDAPASRVWTVITDLDVLGQLMMGARIETDWQVGSTITWSGEYDGKPFTDSGTILEAVPGHRLVHTHASGSGGADAAENTHTLTWELAGTGDRTTLTLSQDQNHSHDEAESATRMWTQVLEGVKAEAEAG